jgi:nitroreductase
MSPLAKPAVSSAPLHPILRDRWSPRAFRTTPVPQDALLSVLEAGRWAASSNNGQPWRWIIATSADASAHAAAVACFGARNQRWAKDAPVLMFSLAATVFEGNAKPNAYAWHDTGAAGAQMSLQATALGLVIHTAGGIEREIVRKTYAVPEDFDICAGLALGYQGEPDDLPEDLPARERDVRVRKPLAELVFEGAFNRPSSVVR